MTPRFVAAVEFDSSDRERFESYIFPEPMSGCLIWIGGRNIWGYGQFWWRGTSWQAHRVAFALKHGRFPNGLGLHSCDVRPCVNADHVREGTYAENSADMVARGRNSKHVPPPMYGEANVTSKYSNDLIAQVLASPLSHVDAAKAFGVGYHTIWKARRGLQRIRG